MPNKAWPNARLRIRFAANYRNLEPVNYSNPPIPADARKPAAQAAMALWEQLTCVRFQLIPGTSGN